jgi:predicted Holliday junction resolvase-like endonuclease
MVIVVVVVVVIVVVVIISQQRGWIRSLQGFFIVKNYCSCILYYKAYTQNHTEYIHSSKYFMCVLYLLT